MTAGRDRAVRLYNTIAECKLTIDDAHGDWITAVRYSPNPGADTPLFVTASYDKTVCVWSAADFKPRAKLVGHTGYVKAIAVSPDGSLCASGGRDGTAMLWDLGEGKRLYSLAAGSEIHSLVFSPNRYWLCAATSKGILIWNLETKAVVAELNPLESAERSRKALVPHCTCLAWSADGETLFAGYTDNVRSAHCACGRRVPRRRTKRIHTHTNAQPSPLRPPPPARLSRMQVIRVWAVSAGAAAF